MRTIALALAVLIAFPLFVAGQAAAKDANRWVEIYVDPATSAADRKELDRKLKDLDRGLLQKPLKTAIFDEKKRPLALTLAIKLKVAGLFDTARKFIDTADEEAIVRLALATQDKGAAQWAFDRWKSLDSASGSFGYVDGGFKSNTVPVDIFTQFKSYIAAKDSNEAKRACAAKILCFQLGVDDVYETGDYVQKWPKLLADYQLDAKLFRISGSNLLAHQDLKIEGKVNKVGENLRMAAESWLQLKGQDEWNTGSFTLTLRVRAISGEGAIAIFQTEKGGVSPKIIDGHWQFDDLDDTALRVKYGEWMTIKWEINNQDPEKMKRQVKLFIDDNLILSNGGLNGPIKEFRVFAGDGPIVIGGADFAKTG
ncbi:MAG: hypothetical protein IT462_10345 [Planctomycetes bacterium]|nr:hypothetical protein [Planctomycetota bacterium]